jgi:Flp pilus assembly protein TadG
MIKKFKKNISGNVAIMFALSLVPLLAGVGVAVDMINFNRVQTVLQAAADAAALAGGSSKNLSKKKALDDIVASFIDSNHANDMLASAPSVTNSVDPTTGAFKVTIEGQIKTSFMGIVGIPQMKAFASSAVSLGIQGMEVALVLDNTGSMAGTKLASLKTAAKSLIQILTDAKADYTDLKFALVPFSKYVNVDTSNSSASWVEATTLPASWNGCVGSRNAPLDEQVGATGGNFPAIDGGVCPTSIMPLTTNVAAINSEIDGMVATGNTYIAGGLLWGWNVLDANAPFTEGRDAAELAAVRGRKVIVLMTDGTNTASPLYPNHDGSDATLANTKLTSTCNAVKVDGYDVYTVLFEEPSPVIKDLLRNCATAPENFFDAASNAALIAAFEQIGRQLSGVRLVQ